MEELKNSIVGIVDHYLRFHDLMTGEEAADKILSLISKTSGGAEVPCNVGLSDLVLRVKLMKAFMDGYEAGHNDTVESAYSDAEDRANDWLDEQEEEGR